jgi:hypothetical protein
MSFICLCKCNVIPLDPPAPSSPLATQEEVSTDIRTSGKIVILGDMILTEEQDEKIFGDQNKKVNGRTGIGAAQRWPRYTDKNIYIPFIFDSSFSKLFAQLHSCIMLI